jgi:hypothetical protein
MDERRVSNPYKKVKIRPRIYGEVPPKVISFMNEN